MGSSTGEGLGSDFWISNDNAGVASSFGGASFEGETGGSGAAASVATVLGRRLLGPLARLFVMCVSVAGWLFDDPLSLLVGFNEVDLFMAPTGGGPRDKRPAKAGFSRPASFPLVGAAAAAGVSAA